jgi:glycosyltransferase involved in cell wall biosynthesis
VEERLWRVMCALERNRVNVQIITELRSQNPETEVLRPGLTVRRIAPVDAGRLWKLYFAVQAFHWNRVVRKYASAHTIWATDPAMAVGALLAVPRRPVIFNPAACAAGMRHIWEQRPEIDSMNAPRHLVWLDRFAYKHSAAIVVSSMNVKRQLERFYGARSSVHVVPYAEYPRRVNGDRASARRHFGIDEGAFSIGFLGRLDPCKDIPFLLAALKLMPLAPRDRLLLVGAGPDEARLRRVAADMGVEANLIWAGRLDDPREALAAMDVMVLPSVYEAFGLVLLEAMASGVPVIARADDGHTVFTAAAEIVPLEAGIVIPSNSQEELAAALRRLKDTPADRERLSEGARRAVEGRTWDDVAAEYIGILAPFWPRSD